MELCSLCRSLTASEDRSVCVQKNEQRRRREKFAAFPEQGGHRFFELPDFALGAAPKTGRVKDDAVVGAAPADFARDEGCSVVNEPADGSIFKLRERLIFASPLDGFSGGIDVRDVGSRSGAGESGKAGIAEERQDFWSDVCRCNE